MKAVVIERVSDSHQIVANLVNVEELHDTPFVLAAQCAPRRARRSSTRALPGSARGAARRTTCSMIASSPRLHPCRHQHSHGGMLLTASFASSNPKATSRIASKGAEASWRASECDRDLRARASWRSGTREPLPETRPGSGGLCGGLRRKGRLRRRGCVAIQSVFVAPDLEH